MRGRATAARSRERSECDPEPIFDQNGVPYEEERHDFRNIFKTFLVFNLDGPTQADAFYATVDWKGYASDFGVTFRNVAFV